MSKKEIGVLGEDLAVKYLCNEGYLVKERNFRKKWGEIDIIAFDIQQQEWVFIEVKTASIGNLLPEEHLTLQKRKRLKRIILTYLSKHHLEDKNWRVDVISLIINNNNSVQNLHHYHSVFLDFTSSF